MSFSCSQTEMISYDISINMIKLHLFTTGLAMAKNDESLDSLQKSLVRILIVQTVMTVYNLNAKKKIFQSTELQIIEQYIQIMTFDIFDKQLYVHIYVILKKSIRTIEELLYICT